MNILSSLAAAPAASLSLAPSSAILAAAELLLPHLERGERIDAALLRRAMETAFGASDAAGAWDWKGSYEACEVATVLFLRKYGKALFRKAASPAARLPGSQAHPTRLVQSAAMASVAPPKPSYRPMLPENSRALLSDAQLETVIYAGEAHGAHLAGSWIVDATWDSVSAAPADAANAVRFRRGFMLGDGTGAGKGRQSAGVILDNWLQGRRKAVWISKSDKLIEDAQRDWSALGMERLLVTPLARFPQGKPITLSEGVLFATYATLRSDDRGEKVSRVRQIVDWLGADFDGVIIFDESHAMQNAGGGKSERGDVAPSQQGRAGLRLQHALPDARVVYVSATGATTVHNLAYAQRLGLWGGEDFPFATRAEFVESIEDGGVAAMEVLARDLRSLGLYTSRSLSYDGVEYELVEHPLTDDQRRIYDAYAGAFSIIHNHLDAAMEAANITGSDGTLNRQAKAAARSAFESTKQRFFGHLLTSMKAATLIRSISRDLEEGHAAVVQIVSTGEALMERRLAEIPTEEWNDLSIDLSPREFVLSYLQHSFPVQLYEPFTDSEGNLSSRPVFRDGQRVECREAVARRDELIERLASLPPVPGALDQIVQRFGTDMVAEVTGRSRRIVRKASAGGMGDRLAVENRAPSANLAETAAFMDDVKRILVFSDAGGTGRSYHADLSAKNQRLRVHYLLEPGWKADAAIQGLGRTNRTNQAQPPLFRPIATDVKAEKRFLSTIARRLDTLGAITRGQRQTGGQGLFRPEDNRVELHDYPKSRCAAATTSSSRPFLSLSMGDPPMLGFGRISHCQAARGFLMILVISVMPSTGRPSTNCASGKTCFLSPLSSPMTAPRFCQSCSVDLFVPNFFSISRGPPTGPAQSSRQVAIAMASRRPRPSSTSIKARMPSPSLTSTGLTTRTGASSAGVSAAKPATTASTTLVNSRSCATMLCCFFALSREATVETAVMTALAAVKADLEAPGLCRASTFMTSAAAV